MEEGIDPFERVPAAWPCALAIRLPLLRSLRRASMDSIQGAVGEADADVSGSTLRDVVTGAAGGSFLEWAGLLIGAVSKATRLMFSRCIGEMLSPVMDPPMVPGPRVIAGKRAVV